MSINNLLLLSSIYENRSYKLIKQAEGLTHPNMIPSLLGYSIPYADLFDWVEKHTSVLKTVKYADWEIYAVNGNIYLQAIPFSHSAPSDKLFFISKTSNPPPNLNIEESNLLQGNKLIPDLYLFKGAADSEPNLLLTNIDLAHENWLVKSLRSLFILGKSNSSLKEINEFIYKNKSKINSLRRHFEISDPEILGKGADGVALGISKNLVLKIFTSYNAYIQTVNSMNRLHKNPEIAKTEAMIYDVGELGEFNGQIIFYYIIEKMLPLTRMSFIIYEHLSFIISTIKSIISKDKVYWRQFRSYLNVQDKQSLLQRAIKMGAISIKNECISKNSSQITFIENEFESKLKSDWLESLAEEHIVKYLTERKDLHMGNIGLTGYGDFRYFDPVYDDDDSSKAL